MQDKSIKIFIPLGTQKFPFNRLIKEINRLIDTKVIKRENVFIQSAIYDIIPLCDHTTILPNSSFQKKVEEADLIITHCGVNSIISCMRLNKKLIIVPRLKQYGEHVDNHQIEIANLMKDKFKICCLDDVSKLLETIPIAINTQYKPWNGNPDQLITTIRNIIINI